MKYYDNGPYLKSLYNSPAKSSTTLVAGLVVCLVVAAGTAIIFHNQLQHRNVHIALMQKEIQALRDINVEKSAELRYLPDQKESNAGQV